MIQRATTERIRKGLRAYPAVVLLGPRQIGKSTLVLALAKIIKKKNIFLDLEKQSDQRKLHDPEVFFKSYQDHLVVIDEVQFMPELFTTLRPVIDEYRKPGRFLLLGSASPELVKGVSESLAGRVLYLELAGVTIQEAAAYKIDNNVVWLKGGFPASLTMRSAALSLQWRKQLIRSFVERDLTALFGKEISESTVRNFWQMVAHQQGRIWNANQFSKSLGVTSPTVKRYLQFMQAAFLLRVVEPWFVNATKRVVKSPKVYVRDTGLLHALLDIDSYPALLGHPVAGTSWEGFVIEQVVQHLPETVRPFFYRTHHGAEADLILVKGIKPIAVIEIKLTNAPVIAKGFYEVLEDLKLKQGFVITPSSDTYPQKQITICSLEAFINQFLPKLK